MKGKLGTWRAGLLAASGMLGMTGTALAAAQFIPALAAPDLAIAAGLDDIEAGQASAAAVYALDAQAGLVTITTPGPEQAGLGIHDLSAALYETPAKEAAGAEADFAGLGAFEGELGLSAAVAPGAMPWVQPPPPASMDAGWMMLAGGLALLAVGSRLRRTGGAIPSPA